MRRAPALLLAALLAAAPAALAAGEKRADERGKLSLIVDYLPAFMYRGEKLAYSFRVERHPKLREKLAFEVSWHFKANEKGKALKPGSAKGVTEKHFTIVRGFLRVPKGARIFRYQLKSGDEVLASGQARLVGEDEPWPKGASAAWNGIVAGGSRIILTLEERVARVDNKWKPIRWIWEKGRSRAESVVLAGPRLAAAGGKSYQDLLAGSATRLKIVELAPLAGGKGPLRAAPAQGIYRLVELVESRVLPASRGADLVVLVTPPEDPEMATEPRRYRQGLDWILSRLKRAKAERVALVPPLTKRVPGKQLAAYAEHCRKAAAVYKTRFLKTDGLLKDEHWVPAGALGKVTGRYPNEKGREVLAELIKAAYK